MAARMPMIRMTTRSSIRVKPRSSEMRSRSFSSISPPPVRCCRLPPAAARAAAFVGLVAAAHELAVGRLLDRELAVRVRVGDDRVGVVSEGQLDLALARPDG